MEIAGVIWKIAGTLAVLGAIGALVPFSYYNGWLPQPSFKSKTKRNLYRKKLFSLMMLSIVPTALFTVVAIAAFVYDSIAGPASANSQLSLGAVQFLEDEPNMIEVLVKNEGFIGSRLDNVEFTVHKIYKLLPMAVTYYVPPPSDEYRVSFDKSQVTPYNHTVKCSRRIAGKSSHRFLIEITPKMPEEAVDYVYEFSIDVHCGGTTLSDGPFLYMGTVGSYPPLAEMDPETRATFKSLHESKSPKNPILAGLLRTMDILERQLKEAEVKPDVTDEK